MKKIFYIFGFLLILIFLTRCSFSYISHKNVHNSEIKTENSQKQKTDVSTPSLSKDIVRGVEHIKDMVKRDKEDEKSKNNDKSNKETNTKDTNTNDSDTPPVYK